MRLVFGSSCLKCNKTLMLGNDSETHVYYIGNDEIRYKFWVGTGVCPGCGVKYEGDDAKVSRKEALNDALDKYWTEKLYTLVEPHKVSEYKRVFKQLIDMCSQPKRRAAEELGLWLSGQHFPP